MAELNIVIKHTKTIAEFKSVYADMKEKANRYFHEHYKAHGEWQNGEPVKVWRNTDGILCIEYESGEWWHYQETDEGLQWW